MYRLCDRSTIDAKCRKFGEYTLVQSSEAVYRSVVVKSEAVVCMAPPRSISRDNFKCELRNTVVNEIVEGTMVNAFYDGEWILCTKSNIGANNTFVPGTPCFKDLFYDAAAACGFVWSDMNTEYSYSFVLQHPKNRIISPVAKPAIYLIAVYLIRKDVVLVMHDTIKGCLQPVEHRFQTFADIDEFLATQPFSYKGVMLHSDGFRVRMRNPAYETVDALRGNHSCVAFRLLELHQSGNLEAFITYFPEHAPVAQECRHRVLRFSNTLYSWYIQIYKQRVKSLRDSPYAYRPHLGKLQDAYVAMKPTPMHKSAVRAFVQQLAAAQLMYVFNQGI